MHKVEAGHYQMGIYHICKRGRAWQITVEDGKGFPFTPLRFDRLSECRSWLGA